MQQSGSGHNAIYILGLRQPLICGCRARPRKLFTARLSICLRVHLYVREETRHPVSTDTLEIFLSTSQLPPDIV